MTTQSGIFRNIQNVSEQDTLLKRQSVVSRSWDEKNFTALFQTELDLTQVMNKNCENMIGSVEIPVGLAGPAPSQIEDKTLELWIPLATTEGALVASVNRGMKLLRESGVVHTLVENKGMSRAPVFQCTNGAEAKKFCDWLNTKSSFIDQYAHKLSSHLTFLHLHAWVQGRHVFARFHFDTQEAMGMNMVTINLEKILQELLPQFPKVRLIAISSNVCGDKKTASINRQLGRGWWAQAEVFIDKKNIEQNLHTTCEMLLDVHTQKNLIGSNLAGSFSQNAHIANVAAAFYLATGQDIAHSVNASLGNTTLESTPNGVYASVTLPEVDVGTVGGGTVLAAQTQARSLICQDKNILISSRLLASTLAVGCLAGELSLLGALAHHQLGRAHQTLGRRTK